MAQPLRIVVADDDRHVRLGLRAFLPTALPCTVVAQAANGAEAIEQVQIHQPDAVVLDLHMPVLDGLAAARVIKERWPRIRIVALTMYAARRADVLAAGADAFVAKGDPHHRLVEALLPAGHDSGFTAGV
jgi:DNA-binding NarL/FixJ family response regulator